MTETSPELDPATAVTVGRIAAARGLRGELRIEPLTDFPERFAPGARLWLDGGWRCVESSRFQGRSVYLKLEGIDDRTAAERLRGHELQLPRAQPLDADDVFYQHDIVGLRVETAERELLGKVESIFSTGANDVYVVRGERGELLLPAVEDVIKQVDINGGRVVVELLPGLEFTKTPAKPVSRRRQAEA